ncbi:MAG: hypothetical protein AAFS10_20435, partial [Myxococcota bacterium]
LQLPWQRRGGELITGLLAEGQPLKHDPLSPQKLPTWVRQTTSDSTDLDRLLRVFIAPGLEDACAELCTALLAAVRHKTLKGRALQMLGLSMLRLNLGRSWTHEHSCLHLTWTMGPKALALAAICWPSALRVEGIHREVRRAAVHLLARQPQQGPCSNPWELLLRTDLCRITPQRYDLVAVAGVMRLTGDAPYRRLVDSLAPEVLLASFRSDPLGGTTLLMPPASSPQEHEARRRLLQIILDSKPVSTTVARIALALTADGVATLGELLPSPDIGKLRPALLAQAVGQAMTDAKRTALAQLLTQPLSSQELGDALIDLVQAPATELRIELLTTLAERFKPRQLRDRLLALANDTIVALLDLESRCVALPYRHRRALVEALTHHPDPRLQRWASHPHQEEAGARLHTRQSDTVVTLDETLGRRLSRCAAGELPGHLEVVYRQQTRGVCKALMERTSDGGLPVRLEICLAALVSADPLYEIAHVFGRFGATDEGFLAVLREQCVSRCVELRGMSPVAHGWLHGWEDHLTDFGTWAVETAGLDNVLESALVLESPALTWMIWLGVERLIGRWRWRTPSELGDRCPARLDHVLVDVLLGDRSGELYPGLGDTRLTPLIRQRAAKTLVHLHMAGVEPTRVQRSADAIIARLSELDNTLREALEPWIDARGVVRTMQLADTVAPATPEELAVIRRCHDLEALTAWCMSASRTR